MTPTRVSRILDQAFGTKLSFDFWYTRSPKKLDQAFRTLPSSVFKETQASQKPDQAFGTFMTKGNVLGPSPPKILIRLSVL